MPQPLPAFSAWKETFRTFHLYLQIVGKIRLKTMPRKNHWWNITLYVNSKGITTGAMPYHDQTFEIQFNLAEHRLEIFTSKGEHKFFSLVDGLSVAEFYKFLFQTLNGLNIQISILNKPYSLPDSNPITTPFDELINDDSYNPELINNYWQVLVWVDNIFEIFSGKFYGKTCPVQIYWHHFDMAVTRFSGKKIPLSPGMKTSDKDAYSHEVISVGFWAGDENVDGAAFYCYAYPSPAELEKQPLQPATAKWNVTDGNAMAMLMYNDLLKEADPKQALLNFMESAYQAGARLAGWDIEDLTVPELADL